MSHIDRIKQLAERAPKVAAALETEEATKNALVMPFIAALGFDVFDPHEVIPEFNADVGIKKGEKVDYAIAVDGRIVILWECKKASETLNPKHLGQLYRYFSVTQARIGVLTNGILYRFYSDLDEPNRMDEKPFLELDLYDLRENHLRELERITKEAFDLDTMLEAASDLKYMREVRRYLEAQFETPSESFVKLCFAEANPQGRFSKSGKEQFTRIARRVLHQMITDRVNERLRNALAQEGDSGSVAQASQPAPSPAPLQSSTESEAHPPEAKGGVETTEDELQAFRVVQAIVCSVVPVERVFIRDTKSYCGVLLDDNNRKPICRLHFNRKQKYVGIFDENKVETRKPIDSVADLYSLASELRAVAKSYLESSDQTETPS